MYHAPVRSRPIKRFFFNDTATTEIYTLSLHDALPICDDRHGRLRAVSWQHTRRRHLCAAGFRSEDHTSELQSPGDLVCRLLLENNKNDESLGVLEHAAQDLAAGEELHGVG